LEDLPTSAFGRFRVSFGQSKRELERRRATASGTTVNKKRDSFVSSRRMEELSAVTAKQFDLTKLTRLCAELDAAYEDDCYMSIGMLVRAIVDHVPPIFNAKTFTEVANKYAGSSSFNLRCSISTSHSAMPPIPSCMCRSVARKCCQASSKSISAQTLIFYSLRSSGF
jgi:hypothetical protein